MSDGQKSGLVGQSVRRVEDDLEDSFTVSEVDKYDATVIPTTVNPAADRDGLANERFIDMTAVVGTHNGGYPGNAARAVCALGKRRTMLRFGSSGRKVSHLVRVLPGGHDNAQRNDHPQALIDRHLERDQVGSRHE